MIGNAFNASAGLFEALSEIDAKFGKTIGKEKGADGGNEEIVLHPSILSDCKEAVIYVRVSARLQWV